MKPDALLPLARRPLGAYLVLIAIAVAANLILTPVYHDGAPDYPVWKIINWFMAVGTFLVLVVSVMRRHALSGRKDDALAYVRASAVFYGAIVLTILFFWGWFWTLNPESETGLAVTSHLIYFPAVNSLFVVLSLSSGRHLWDGGE